MISRSNGREVLVRTFWDSYDYLGRLILINLLGLTGLYVAQLLSQLIVPLAVDAENRTIQSAVIHFCLLVILSTGLMIFWSTGLVRFLRQVSKGVPVSIRDYFRFCLRPSLANVLFWCLLPLLTGYLFISHLAYSSVVQAISGSDFLYAFLVGISFWFSLVLVLRFFAGIWLREMGLKLDVKSSFLLLVKYSRLMISFVFYLLLLMFLIYISRFAVLVILGFVLPFVWFNALMQVVWERETAVPVSEETNDEAPASWKDKVEKEKGTEDFDALNERYNRNFRDIIKPWGDQVD